MISKGATEVTNRMSNDLSHWVVLNDLYHVFNLVIKNCINTFTKVYRDHIANISSIFADSAKKSAEFKELLKGKEEHILAIKRFVFTRWKSFYECLDRIVKLDETLRVFLNMKENVGCSNKTSQNNALLPNLDLQEEKEKKHEKQERQNEIKNFNQQQAEIEEEQTGFKKTMKIKNRLKSEP